MNTLYLHIGAHKTGSTSIQRFLARNREALRETGYLVPRLRGGEVSTNSLPWLCEYPRNELQMSERVRYQLDTEELLGQLRGSDCDRAILSTENFSWLRGRDAIGRLCQRLEPLADEIRVIYFVRRQDRLAVSHHQQAMKGRNTRSYEYYGGVDGPFSRAQSQAWDYLDFHARYLDWAAVFGETNMRLQVFEPVCFLDGDLLKQMLALCDLEWSDAFAAVPQVNESLCASAQLLLEYMDPQWPIDARPAVRRRRRQLNEQVVRWNRRQTLDQTRLRPARGDAEAFYARFRDSNEQLRQRVFPQRERLFSDDFSDYPEQDGRLGVDPYAYNELLCYLLDEASIPTPKVTPDQAPDARQAEAS